MFRLYYFGLVYLFYFGAPRHMLSNTDTYADLHTSSDQVRSSIQIHKSVYIYLWFEFGTLNNTIIFVRPVPDINILLVESSTVVSGFYFPSPGCNTAGIPHHTS